MIDRRHLRLVALLALAPTLSCVRGEQVEVVPTRCDCYGVRCLNGAVGRREFSADYEESDPCLACHIRELGRCAEGCGEATYDLPGCAVAYGCKSWSRVTVGDPCATDRDCEPGVLNGEVVKTLGCREGRCTDLGDAKWATPPTPVVCSGAPAFDVHAECGGAACLAHDDYAEKRYCAAAKCLDDRDCPTGWRCHCREETTPERLLKAWRWCLPELPAPDAGS